MEFNKVEIPGDETEISKPGTAAIVGRWAIKRLREFITLLVLGALAVWQLPKLFKKVSDTVSAEAIPATGWGLVVILVFYVGAFLLGGLILAAGIFFGIITLGGLAKTILGIGFSGLAMAITAFGLLVSYVSKLVVAMAAGNFIFQKLAPQHANNKVWPLLVGILLYVILRSIPIFGWILGVFVTLAGIGAMWLLYRSTRTPTPEITAEA